jgi:hypothetical protein
MTELLKRLHIWIGLFNFTILIVFALAGLHATIMPAPAQRPTPAIVTREVEYETPPDFTDAQVADDLYRKLELPLVGPIPEWAIGRNAENVLVLEFHSPNGVHRATVLEEQKKVRIEHSRTTTGEFLNVMHATTIYHSTPDWRVRLWSLYVDLSIFSLLFMVATGMWLWLATRPKLWWAGASFGAGTALFAFLYAVIR